MDLSFEVVNGKEGVVAKGPDGSSVAMLTSVHNRNYFDAARGPREWYFFIPLVRNQPEVGKMISAIPRTGDPQEAKQRLIDLAKRF